MQFYNRKNELRTLQLLFDQSVDSAKMTVLTGRRRIGKTLLVLEFCKERKFLYLFVSKKAEPLLCTEYIQEIKNKFDTPVIGEIKTIKDIFKLLLDISSKERFTLIIDEFQEFYNINPAVFSDLQHLWDLHKNKSHLNLIVIGSVYSLIHKIFSNSKEPLFGRADRILFLKPFSIKTIFDILNDFNTINTDTLFYYYVFTGGIPKYIDLLITNSVFSVDRILNFMIAENSPFINEGKHLLIEEFGKEYGIYFSILELISIGKTSRTEIESMLERNVGGYLNRLENDYAIISKRKPITAKPNTRLQKYFIVDNFIRFWFRFIYRNRSAVETGNFEYIKDIIKRDFTTYCGKILEKFFHEIIAETKQYNRIGTYWEKGNQNEIDLVAINDMEKKLLIAEIKLNKSRININALKQKSEKLLRGFPTYASKFRGFSPEDALTLLQKIPGTDIDN